VGMPTIVGISVGSGGDVYVTGAFGIIQRYTIAFTADVANLSCGTTYHVRAKAESGVTTAHGADKTFTTDACPEGPDTLSITTTDLEEGYVGEDYLQLLEADSQSDVSWQLAGGSLPAGLTLDQDGTISGTPTQAGRYSFTVQASNDATTATASYQIIINSGGDVDEDSFTITTTDLAVGTVGQEYSDAIATNSDQPARFELTQGELPPGLELAEDGSITGTPSEVGLYSFSVAASTDTASAEQDLAITVLSPDNYVAQSTKVSPLRTLHTNTPAANSLFGLVQKLPYSLQIGLPWLLLLLALILVGSQYYQVHAEQISTAKIQGSLVKQQQLVEEQNNFVALTTHYVHTPLTVMEGEIALMVQAGTMSQDQATKLQASLALLGSQSEQILRQIDSKED